jgi:hypothetical protein
MNSKIGSFGHIVSARIADLSRLRIGALVRANRRSP